MLLQEASDDPNHPKARWSACIAIHFSCQRSLRLADALTLYGAEAINEHVANEAVGVLGLVNSAICMNAWEDIAVLSVSFPPGD